MKRETAKKLIETFNDEELFELGYHAGRSVLDHYAKGGSVLFKERPIGDYETFRHEHHLYSLVPSKYKLLGIEIEGEPPLNGKPHIDQMVYYLESGTYQGYEDMHWANGGWQNLMLKRGVIFATEEAAKTAAKALGWCDEEE